MKRLVVSLFLFLSVALGVSADQKTGCILAQKGALEVSWTGYKTDDKIAVGGTFNKVVYTPVAPQGSNFRSILVGSSVTIDTASVNSKNGARDEKLAKFFFGMMSDKNIYAKIVDIRAHKKVRDAPRMGVVKVDITMNGITKNIFMTYTFKDGIFEAKGKIDILDFGADNALASINKACFDLHKGKTWSEAEVGFKTKIEAILCHSKPLEMSK